MKTQCYYYLAYAHINTEMGAHVTRHIDDVTLLENSDK